MTKIIPFRPQTGASTSIEQKQTQQQPQQYNYNYPSDSFEFMDEIIEDEPTFMDKVKALFGKDDADCCDCLQATSQMREDAINLQFRAIRTKQKVSDLIALVDGNYNCSLVNKKNGSYVTFEEDNLGRMVMLECNENGDVQRQTTFYQDNEQILSVETFDTPKSSTKIIFFNYKDNYFEIRKESNISCLGNYQEEIYSYRYNKPEALTLKKGNIFKSDVKKETYFF